MIQSASPEQVREITKAVLKRPEFQSDASEAWIARTLQSLLQWLSKLSQWAGSHPSSARALIYILGTILIILLTHIGYTVISEFLSLRKRNADIETRNHALPALDGVAENWNDAFALAKTALAAGDLYRALWITHRILLSVLDLRDLVRFARWKTNSDYIRECRASDPAAAMLREITNAYERVIYAHGDFDRAHATHLVERVESFANEAGR
jgi:hypothetical protein